MVLRGLFAGSLLTFAPITASLAQAAIKHRLDIPAQELGAALATLARQAKIQVVYSADLVQGRQSRALSGSMTPEEALEKLLAATSMKYEFVDPQTVTLSTARGSERGAQNAPLSQAPADERQNMWSRITLAQATSESSVATASSSQSIGSGGALEEIIVSAQKRDERLQDVPISIGVLSGADLDQGSSRSIADVLNQVGGVSMIERAPGYTQIALRGVVPDQSLGTSATGYYLDEVPFAFITKSHLPDANAFDLARVEVLRGPQGTLYGANALSGVVRVLSNDADLDVLEAKGRARGSRTEQGGDNFGGDLALNVPLIPGELALRAVASYADLSGYIDTDGGHRRFNDTRAHFYRLKANYQPNENLSVKLGLTRSQIDNGGPSYAYDDLTTPFSDDQADRRVYDAYNLVAEYRWSSWSLLSSTSYLEYTVDTQTEIEAFPGFFLNFLNSGPLRSFSQEFRLASDLAGPWRWSAGAIYKDTTEQLVQEAPAFFDFPLIEQQQSDSYAAFGELTRIFADGRFELAGGLRYYDEHTVATEIGSFFGAPTTAPRPADFDGMTGRVVLAYKPLANRTYYASVASGFRAGLHQSAAVAGTNPEFGPVDPDKLINYEVGAKGSLLNNVVTFDAAAYFMDWQDIQQSVITDFGFVAGLNAGSASGVGFDGTISYHPLQALTLQANVGWSGLELDSDVPFSTPPVVLFQGGERVNLSPEWTGSVGGSYRVATAAAGLDAVISSSFSYRSSVTLRYLAAGTLTPFESEATRNLKASVGLESDRWTLTLFGDNLLDDRDGIMPPDFTFAGTSIRQRPRTIGLQATFDY